MRDTIRFSMLAGIVGFLGCGGGAAGPGDTPGAGPDAGSPTSGFRLSGTVLRTQAALTAAAPNPELVALDPLAPKTVTHVMAVNPSSQDHGRILAPVTASGAFTLDLAPGHPWVLVFVDSSRVGADMIAGVFRASELDSIAPTMPGSADLGMVEVTAGTATAGIAYDDLLAALHLSSAGADFLGASDDVCLRYVNPDIDGDGKIDLQQMNRDFGLDFHVQYAMASGAGGLGVSSTSVTVADIAAGFLPGSTGVSYGGVGVYATYTSAFATVAPADTWVAFDGTAHYAPGGPTFMGPRTVAGGTHVPGSDLTFMDSPSSHSQGISMIAGFDLPQGMYQFGVGAQTLTFTHVRTHSDAEFAAADNLIMPFVRLRPTDGCVGGDCTLAAVDFMWMKRTGGGWVTATVEELGLAVSDQGGYISIVKGFDNGDQHIGLTIPSDVAQGTVSWTSARLDNLTAAELAATKVNEVCHFGLSYDDKLGMRIFSGIGNAPGTCAFR